MKSIVLASTNKSAGKTSILTGLMAQKKGCGYLKPLGDRLVYQGKRLWDHDASLMKDLCGLKQDPDELTLGFDHTKLRYMYDQESMRKRLVQMAAKAGEGKDILYVEGGEDLTRGTSVNLDLMSITKDLDAKLVLVVDGEEYDILDDILFYKRYVDSKEVRFGGVIINKLRDVADFRQTHLEEIKDAGVPVLGMIPYTEELTHFMVEYLSEYLFCKVVAGEKNLDRRVKNIFFGAMAATSALENPAFKREDTLVVTTGDRSDMILAAIETNASAIVLTNDIMPHPGIVSRALESGTPILLTSLDMYRAALQLEYAESLVTKSDKVKIDLLKRLVSENVDTKALTE